MYVTSRNDLTFEEELPFSQLQCMGTEIRMYIDCATRAIWIVNTRRRESLRARPYELVWKLASDNVRYPLKVDVLMEVHRCVWGTYLELSFFSGVIFYFGGLATIPSNMVTPQGNFGIRA